MNFKKTKNRINLNFMKKLLFVCVIALTTFTANAQYKWGIGAAIGSPSGLSVKVFSDGNKAFDFTLGFWHDYTNITAMYEIHNSFNDLGGLNEYRDQFQWYYGPGAHIGSWNDNHYDTGEPHDSELFIGVDGVIGIEWKPDIPLALSLDIRPGINLVGGTSFFIQSQLGIRYTFDR